MLQRSLSLLFLPELTINNYPLTIHDHPPPSFLARTCQRIFFFLIPLSERFRFMQCAFVKTDLNGRHALLNLNIFVYFITMFSLGI